MLARRAKSSLARKLATPVEFATPERLWKPPDNNIAGGPFWSARQRRLNPLGCGRRLRWGT